MVDTGVQYEWLFWPRIKMWRWWLLSAGFCCLGRSEEAEGREGGLCIIRQLIPGWLRVQLQEGTGQSPALSSEPRGSVTHSVCVCFGNPERAACCSGTAAFSSLTLWDEARLFTSHVHLPAVLVEHLVKFQMLFNVQIHEILLYSEAVGNTVFFSLICVCCFLFFF